MAIRVLLSSCALQGKVLLNKSILCESIINNKVVNPPLILNGKLKRWVPKLLVCSITTVQPVSQRVDNLVHSRLVFPNLGVVKSFRRGGDVADMFCSPCLMLSLTF